MNTKPEVNNILKSINIIILFVLFMTCFHFTEAQDYPHEISQYPFIKYDQNKLDFYGDSSHFNELFNKFDEVIFEGKGQVDIMHIGGSHVQAGVFSARVRSQFQRLQPGLNSYRGFIFPFRVAGTNNPVNYSVRYKGEWSSCRNVERKKNCTLGLSGMSVTTRQSNASIKITFNEDYLNQPFTRLKVYHPQDSSQFSIKAKGEEYTVVNHSELGYSELVFESERDSINLEFVKEVSNQSEFTLYGLKFENDDAGFAYHAIGVNGADVPAYLRCNLLSLHTKSVMPDIVIFAIGINDANTTRFNKKFFMDNYDKLIAELKEANPNLKIIFITNNDSYFRRKYPNENATMVQEAMIELSKKHNAAVWDLFTIMGGLDSISQWNAYGLAQRDKIHFTRAGYQLVGDLLFSAIVKSYEYHIKRNPQ